MDWEARYQAEDTPWHQGGAAHPALLRFLHEGVPAGAWVNEGASGAASAARAAFCGWVLVPGCGFGADVRAIAGAAVDAHPESLEGRSRVVGIDIAPTAIERALALPKAGKESAESFEVVDLMNLPESFRAAFDGVWEHTCFCAIDPADRGRYVDGVRVALREGGYFLAVFYIEPDMEPGEEGPPFGVSRSELDEFFDAGFEKLAEWEPETFPTREGRELVRLYRRLGSV